MSRLGVRADPTARLPQTLVPAHFAETFLPLLQEEAGDLDDLIAVRKPGGLGVHDEDLHVSPTRCDAERCAVVSIASRSSDAVSDVKLVNGMS